MLNAEVKQELKQRFEGYKESEFEAFKAEYGWADWMEEFTTAKDGEEITEKEESEIDRELMTEWEDYWKRHNNAVEALINQIDNAVMNAQGDRMGTEDITTAIDLPDNELLNNLPDSLPNYQKFWWEVEGNKLNIVASEE